jgi:hypothetical protein
MRFRLQLDYAAAPDAVAAAYADPALYEAFAGLPRADRPEVVDRRREGDEIVLRVRWRFSAHLSPAARAVIDPERLSWIEESRHDLARRHVQFRMLADHYADRFACSGEYRFDANGAGTRRVIEGNLSVKALLVARAVEQAIVSGLEDQLTCEVPIVDAFLAADP